MKISEGLSLPGKRVEIPGCGRDGLPEFFLSRGLKTGAEIGVYRGEFTEVLCKGGLNVYAIDPWIMYSDYFERVPVDSYPEACERLAPYKNCKIIKETSMDALKLFRDRSLDWVYIDGNHSFAYVAQDLYFWSKKVKKGGVISGHDYYLHKSQNPLKMNVKQVVDAFVQAARIPKLYILGRKKPEEGEHRDKYRSFMWINP